MMALDKTFASGEVLSAGDVNNYLRSLWTPIDKRVVASGSPVTSVSFASLDSNFRMFRLAIHLTPASGGFGIRFNNDSGNNYTYQELVADGASVGASRASGDNMIAIGGGVPSVAQMIIGKATTAAHGRLATTVAFDTGASFRTNVLTGFWNNTASLINRIDVAASSGSFYGIAALEGMRGV